MSKDYRLKDTIKIVCLKEYHHKTSNRTISGPGKPSNEIVFNAGEVYDVKYSDWTAQTDGKKKEKVIVILRGTKVSILYIKDKIFYEHFALLKELRKLKLKEIESR